MCVCVISPQWLKPEASNFVRGSAMQSLSLVISEYFLSRHGQGHVSNFYIVDLENFTTASQLDRRWCVYDTLPPTKRPTSYHRFGQDLSCCVVIGKITTDKTHRAVTRR